jgi:tetratricopeptide (TPR) repeat protein
VTANKAFFISYTGTDTAWAEWIAETLERGGHSTILQAWDFRPGENFVQRMSEALAEAERVLAVISPAFFQSEYAGDEWTAALVRDRGQPARLLPVRVAPCELPPLLADRIYIDLTGLDEQTAVQRLLAGVQVGRAKPSGRRPYPGGQATISTVSFPGRRPVIFDVPPRNLHFTGRSDLLKSLRRTLRARRAGAVVQAGAVYGLGGVGKTQLAVEYAHRYAADYDLVWWISAEQRVALGGRLAALARRLGLPELPSLEEQVGVLFDALGQRDRWLLVYDNAQAPADLDRLRPPAGSGHLLVTSRNPAWGGMATTIAVDVLPRDQAIGFLLQRTNSSDQAILERLAEALGDLPLALEQAAAFMAETRTPPAEYLDLLRERASELFGLGTPSYSEQTVATTWTLALRRLRKRAPAAEDLLTLCAFLAPDDIPLSLLDDHPEQLPEQLATVVRDRLALRQATGALGRYALATVTDQALGVHRLVQAVVRQRLDGQTRQAWAASATRLLCAAFPGRPEKVTAWPVAGRLLPHALAVTDQPDSHNAEPESTAILLSRAARYLWGRAEHSTAMRLLERALAICQASLPADHPTTAQCLITLGLVLRDQGDLDRAHTHLERALSIHKARFGPDHPTTAWSLNHVANVLHARGDLDGARSLHERAVAIFEARLGADDLATANSLENLAGVLFDQGDLDGARTLFERVLAIREACLGAYDPDTAFSLNNLALVLRDQGDLDGARSLHERAVAIREARLGPDHPTTAISLADLGAVLRDQGDLEGARSLHERALAIREAHFGADHPDTAISLSNLAKVLRDQGDLEGARGLHERALGVLEARLGPGHFETAWGLHNLALVLHDQGDLLTARTLFERALAVYESRLGSDHPETAWSLSNLAAVLHDQGDLPAARALLVRALAIREGSLGPGHPETVRSREALAAVITELGE